MVVDDNPMEAVDVVVRRLDVLECLLDAPCEKRELVDQLELSRTTVDRSVRELETRGLVEYGEGSYRITAVGEVVVSDVLALLDRIRYAEKLAPVLRWLPLGEFDLDLRHLADADVVDARTGDPYAMVNRHVHRLSESDHVRTVLPLLGLHAAETLRDQVVDEGARCQVVVEQPVVETIRTTPAYRDVFEEMLATGRCETLAYDGSVPYYLGVLDDVVQVGVDEDGEPRALLESRSDEVLAWAEASVEQYATRADEFSP